MKRLVLTVFSVLYLLSATGASVQLHFCMGVFDSWSLVDHLKSVCGSCGMDKKTAENDNCCRDESTYVQSQSDQQMANAFISHLAVPVTDLSPVKTVMFAPAVDINDCSEILHNNSPPPLPSTSFIYIRSIRI